jgi:hypothetical protein
MSLCSAKPFGQVRAAQGRKKWDWGEFLRVATLAHIWPYPMLVLYYLLKKKGALILQGSANLYAPVRLRSAPP